jgi:hypothetical protein
MPIGATFSDLRILGAAGAQTPVCNAPVVPDSGPPVERPCADGSLGALGDAVAASFAPGVFPDAHDLNVEGDGAGGASAIVYLAFPAPAGRVARAWLRLRTRPESSSRGGSGIVCAASSVGFDESSLTFGNRPALTSLCAGDARRVAPDEDVEWDVTPLFASASPTVLAIVSTDADGAHYVSREAGGCALGPRLQVELAPTLADAGIPRDAGTSVDAGTMVDAWMRVDAGAVAGLDAGAPGVPDAGTPRAPDGGGDASRAEPSMRFCASAGGRGAGGYDAFAALALILWLARRARRATDYTRPQGARWAIVQERVETFRARAHDASQRRRRGRVVGARGGLASRARRNTATSRLSWGRPLATLFAMRSSRAMTKSSVPPIWRSTLRAKASSNETPGIDPRMSTRSGGRPK